MPWSTNISWWPCHDLAMIIPWQVKITMTIPCHSMIVILDHDSQPGKRFIFKGSIQGSFKECSDLASSLKDIKFSWKILSKIAFNLRYQGHWNSRNKSNLFMERDKSMSTIENYWRFCPFKNVGQGVILRENLRKLKGRYLIAVFQGDSWDT